MNIPLTLTLVGIGFGGAFFSGLLGIGGAIILIPLLMYVPQALGVGALDMQAITGMTMVQVLFASLSGYFFHKKNKTVSAGLVVTMGVSIIVGSLFGSVISKFMTGEWLKAIFAFLAAVAAVMMFIPRKEEEKAAAVATGDGGGAAVIYHADPVNFNKPLAAGIALTVGILAGMVGAGGAFILIPLMLYVLKIPTRIAVGSSLAIILFSAAAGAVGKLFTGQIPLLDSMALVIGAIPGAQFGGVFGKRVKVKTLRLMLAVIISLTALKLWLEILG